MWSAFSGSKRGAGIRRLGALIAISLLGGCATQPSGSSGPFRAQYVAGLEKPEVVMVNRTDRQISLRVSGAVERHLTIPAGGTSTTSLPAGAYEYSATAAGVMPCSGTESFEKNYRYTWEFTIVTSAY